MTNIMDYKRKFIVWIVFCNILRTLLLSSHDAVAARIRDLNFTKLMHEYFLACGYSYLCNPSSLDFVPKDISPDFLNYLGYINECPRCSCEGSCVSEGNCCPDVYFNLLESKCTILEQINFNNSVVSPSHYIDIVDKCQTSQVSTSVSNNCTKKYQKTDLLQNVPVTSKFQTFRNKYCAECNNVKDYKEWGFNIMCNNPADFNYLSSYEDIASLAATRGCVFKYKLYEEGYTVKSCHANQSVPVPSRILYHKCNQTGFWRNFDHNVDKACESNYNLTYRFYKNIFCYICNPPLHFVSSDTLISGCNSNIVGQYAHILRDHCRNFGKSLVMQPYKNVFCYLCNVGRQNPENVKRILKEGSAEIYDYFGVDQKNYTINFLFLNIMLKPSAYNSFISNLNANQDFAIYDKPNIFLYQQLGINITNLLMHEFGWTGFATYCEQYFTQQQFIVPPADCSCNPTCFFPISSESCCSDMAMTKPVSCYDHVILKPNPNIHTHYLEYQMIDRCFLERRNITNKQKNLCEHGSGIDIYSRIPIVWNRITYKNAHCFFCNLDSTVRNLSSNIDAMDLKIYCDLDIRYGPLNSLQKLIDIARSSNCHIEVYQRGDMLHRKFGKSYGSQIIQVSITDEYLRIIERWKYRDCNVKETFTCNNTGKWKNYDDDVLVACEQMDHPLLTSYRKKICEICNPVADTVPVTFSSCGVLQRPHGTVTNATVRACEVYPEIDRMSPYKNIYCGICNGLEIIPPTGKGPPGKLLPIYNFNRKLFRIPEKEKKPHYRYRNIYRSHEEFYDIVNRVIRNITCYPGKMLLNGECTSLLRYASNMRYSLNLELAGNVTVYSSDLLFSVTSLTESVIHKIQYITGNDRQDFDWTAYITNRPCAVKAYSRREIIPLRVYMQTNFLVRNTIDRHKIEAQLVNMTSLSYEFIFGRVEARFPRKYINITQKTDLYYNCSVEHLQSVQDIDNYNISTVSKLLLCPQTVLQPHEFTIHLTDRSLSVNGLKTKLLLEQYIVMDNGETRVCVEDLKELMTFKANAKSDSWVLALNITNFICVLLSLLCLLITFIVYCTFPSLRSLPGKNNMTLVLTLFFSQLTLYFGAQSPGFPSICMTLGIASHYFVLCMFASMNVCSFHMHSIFVNKLHERSSNEGRTLTKYLIYIFISPLVIVGLNVAIVYQITNTIGYGNNPCFINNRTSYIISFYVPVILLCVLNTFLFMRTIYAIRQIPKLQSNKKHQNTAKIYAKLFTITGITWILIVIDANFPVTVVSFIIVFLNAGQGIFIFVSFVCNENTYRMFRNISVFSNSSTTAAILQLRNSGSYTISSTKTT